MSQDLWERDPVLAFEQLRDRVCDAIDIVVAVHSEAAEAKGAGKDFNLADIDPEVRARLDRSLVEGQALFYDTPLAGFLDRLEGPVYFDDLPERSVRVSGSCFHDLALAVGCYLQQAIGMSMTAAEYAREMRFRTSAGDDVSQHIAGLKPKVRCESLAGIEKWRAESRDATGSAARRAASEPETDVTVPELNEIFARARGREVAREAERRNREESASCIQSIVELYGELAHWYPGRLESQFGRWPTKEEEHTHYARLVARICHASRDAKLADGPPNITANSDGERMAIEILHRAFRNDAAGIEYILRSVADSSPRELGNEMVGALLRILRYEILRDLQSELDSWLGKGSPLKRSGRMDSETGQANGVGARVDRDDSVKCPDCNRPFRPVDPMGRMGCPDCQITLAHETEEYPSVFLFLDVKNCFVPNPTHPNFAPIEDLHDWQLIRHFACGLFQHPDFSETTLQRLDGWLKIKRPGTDVCGIPLSEVARMLSVEIGEKTKQAEGECETKAETKNRADSETAIDLPPRSPGRKLRKDKKRERRDKMIYGQIMKGNKLDAIGRSVLPEDGGPLSKQRVHQIGQEYAKRHNKPMPDRRQSPD